MNLKKKIAQYWTLVLVVLYVLTLLLVLMTGYNAESLSSAMMIAIGLSIVMFLCIFTINQSAKKDTRID